ncbi:hypothetical protein [Clostridium merdae]|uniref:hypothetical protein n=1 Tax=Clostridium merdae TaxID=1958780 RepID=UPI00164EB5F0|nr:hypothetical protein [Clostridium merdae]
MDYSDFSFPQALSEDRKLKEFFDALPELDQLRLMQGCSSYGEFYDRVVQAVPKC